MSTKPNSYVSRRQFLRQAATAVGGLTLAACTPGQAPPQTTGIATPTTAPTVAPTTAPQAVAAPTTVPIAVAATTTPASLAPLNISVMWRGPTNPVNKEAELYKELVRRTGVAYDGFGLPPGPEYTQRVHAVMASGQPPDLMWVNDTLAYIQYAQQGAFWELDEFLKDKNALPQLTSYADYNYDAIRVNGKVYGIPSVRIYRGFPIHVRTDWLDKLGLKMPTTVDELWQVAEAFATRDPDGNGRKDTYGLMWWQDLNGLDQILSGFGIVSSWEEDKPGHIIPAYITPKQKNLLAWLRRGIEAGIFDPDSPIMKRDDVETVKAQAGKAGIFYTGLGGQTLNALQKNTPSAQLMPLPPLLTPEGKYTYNIPYLYIGIWVINKSVKNPEDVKRILKFIDYGSSPEGSDLMAYGLPGDYDVRPDGSKTVNEKGKANGADALWLIPPPDKYLYVTIERSTGHPQLAEAQRKLVDSVAPVESPDPILFTTPGPVEQQKGSELGRRRSEVFTQILAGQLPITAFDDWVAEWRRNGGDQIIEERSAAYAAKNK